VICASTDASGAVIVAPVQPADLSTCAVVLVTGSELSALREGLNKSTDHATISLR